MAAMFPPLLGYHHQVCAHEAYPAAICGTSHGGDLGGGGGGYDSGTGAHVSGLAPRGQLI